MSASLVDKITNKLEFSKRNGIAITGNPADEIIVHGASGVNKVVKEEKEKRAVFTFGRFNPPTTGHQKLIDAVKSAAQKQGGEHHIFASHTQDKTKNPLGFDEKVGFMKKMYPKTNINSSHAVRNILDAAKSLQARGVTHGTLVVGSDRVDEFHNLLSKYNKHPSDPNYDPKKHFHIPHLSVVSAGQRDPDAEGVEGMSASKMRGHATAGNFEEFSKGVPNQTHAKPMYDAVRNRMGIKEETTLTKIIFEKLNLISELSPAMKQRWEVGARSKFKGLINQPNTHKKTIRMSKAFQRIDIIKFDKKEETIPTPFQRDELAPGNKPVDIGMDKDLEPHDTNKQLKRRKSMKLFKAYVEGIDGEGVAGSEKPGVPAPVTTALPSNRLPSKRSLTSVKQKHPIAAVSATEEADDESGMAKNQLDTVIRGAKELKSKIKNKKDLPAWVQSKITKGEDQIDTAADYMKSEEGLWANIHAKRKRIKAGSGESMRKPGEKGAPTPAGLKSAQEEFDNQIDEKSDTGLAAKAKKSGISIGTLRKVYNRGIAAWNSGHRPGTTPQQWAFARVNSYITKGKGTYYGADKDLHEEDEEYADKKEYHAGLSKSTAKARVRHWTKMSKYSDKDSRAYEPAPGDSDAKTKESKHTKKYHQMYGEESHTNCGTPECCGECDKGYIEERGADSKGFFRPTEKGAGLTPKGAKHFGIQTAVTGKVKPGSKAAGRRKSFCARMGGMRGPMKDEKGRPTRKAMSLRRWRCRT